MKNYKNYIYEINSGRQDTNIISEDEFYKLIKENCKEFIKNPKAIYRTVSNMDEYVIIDPKKNVRKSLTGDNLYNVIIDGTWKNYPKRNESICCSSKDNIAFFGYSIYFVIPFDNSNWGVCPTNDMWSSINLFHTDIKNFIRIYNIIYSKLFNIDIIISDIYNLEDLKYHSNLMQQRIKTEGIDVDDLNQIIYDNDIVDEFSFEEIIDTLSSDENFFEKMVSQMTPDKLKFKNVDYNNLEIRRWNAQELWTDSKCLLKKINKLEETFDSFISTINFKIMNP
jgi:hypothetical protein